MLKPLLALLAICSLASSAPAATDRTVVLISLDGLAHYYFDDPKAEMPTLRELAAQGARARTMRPSMPTVTWPNHTTLVTGVNPARHGVIGNEYVDRATGLPVQLICDPVYDKEQIVRVSTLYDVAKAAGLSTAGVIWPATRGVKTLDWTVPDVLTNALFEKYGTPALLQECKEAQIPCDMQETWCKTQNGEERDKLYVQMFRQILRAHRPNLALLHLINVDHMEHVAGPQSPEAYAAIKAADAQVHEVWEQLKSEFADRATLVVVSDHGFHPFRQLIAPNVLLRKAGMLEIKGLKITGGGARCLSQGGGCFVYLLDSAKRDEWMQSLPKQLAELEGVAHVWAASEFKTLGMATPAEDPHAPDLVLSAKDGYSFTDLAAGELTVTPLSDKVRGSHGYNLDDPAMGATFIACGRGIRSGVVVDHIANIDVAPTLASLLGLEMKDVEGKRVDAILDR